MLKLRVDAKKALNELDKIPHKTFHAALPNHWHVDKNGTVRSQSVCWLFCWAKTGLGSKRAAAAAEKAFDAILDMSFSEFDKHIVDYSWAQQARYAKGNIDKQLSERLKRKP